MIKLFKKTFIILLLINAACAGDDLFIPIEDSPAGPVDLAIDSANEKAYLLNANLDNRYTSGSIIVLDLSDPTNPVLDQTVPENPIEIKSLSGQILLNQETSELIITNRYSSDRLIEDDQLLLMDLSEAAFGTITEITTERDPFDIICCDSSERFYTIADGILQSFAKNNVSAGPLMSCSLEVGNLGLSGIGSREGTIVDDTLYLSNRAGFIYVIDTTALTETLNKETPCPLQNMITRDLIRDFRGITSDGTYLYVVESFDENIDEISQLFVIDLSLLPDPEESRDISLANAQAVPPLTLDIDSAEVIYSETTNKLYVSNIDSDTLSVIDLSDRDNLSDEHVSSLQLNADGIAGDSPYQLKIAALGEQNYLFVTLLEQNTISRSGSLLILNLETLEIVGRYR